MEPTSSFIMDLAEIGANNTSNITPPNGCNWTSDNCPHHKYYFFDDLRKTRLEGRQSRF